MVVSTTVKDAAWILDRLQGFILLSSVIFAPERVPGAGRELHHAAPAEERQQELKDAA